MSDFLLPPLEPPAAPPKAPLPFVRRHATGLTVVCFFVVAGGLGVAPVPERVQPVRLQSPADVQLILDRVLKKPRMTLAKMESPVTPLAEEREGEVVLDDGPAEGAAEGPAGASLGASPERLDPLGEIALAPSTLGQPEPLPNAPLDAPTPASLRRRDESAPSKQVQAWRKLASKLGARAVSVENPCVRFDAEGCTRTALDPFFASLDAVDRDQGGSHATVVTLGNSLIASDHVTDVVRARLVQRFGSGGPGFLLPDRLSKAGGRRVRTGRGDDSWEFHTFAHKPPRRTEFGFTGSMHESTKAGDRIVWKLGGSSRVRLFYLDHPDNPGFTLDVDGRPLKQVTSLRPAVPEDRLLEVELEKTGAQLRLTAEGPGVVLYGVALAKDAPGVVWDTIGVPASDASMYVGTDEGIFRRQLQAREPSLVVVMVGGNEIRSLAYGWVGLEEVRRHYAALLDRVKESVPEAACLAISPIDAAKATAAGAELTTRRETLEVVALEREVALEKGCGFFNLFDAMGGEGSLERFHRDGLINDDLVHPKGAGGDVLGNLIADALLDAYRATPAPRDEVRVRRRLVRPPLYGLTFPRPTGETSEDKREPLAPLFARLRELELGRGQRLGVGLFGGLHVAGEAFPARIRQRLQERFGDAGRGLLGVGPGNDALLRTGVQRALSGPVEWRDGRSVTVGGAMSLFGDAVRLSPEGRLDVRLCEDCQETRLAARGTLELTWLYTPDMGTADVVVNDVQVATLSPAGRRVESDVQRLRVPVRGQQHTVSVQTRALDDDGLGGPVHLFSLAVDLQKPGVVVDSIGIPGSTGMTMQRWRQDLLREQTRAREYGVVILAFGEAEVTLTHLDEVTYAHHLNATVSTLLEGNNTDACILMGPTDREIRGRPYAPIHDLIETTQREVAAAHGCAYFATRAAMGGQGSLPRWRDQGLADKSGVTLTDEGYQRLADLLLHDLLALYAYDTERLEQERLDAASLEVAKGQPTPLPAGTRDDDADEGVKPSGRRG